MKKYINSSIVLNIAMVTILLSGCAKDQLLLKTYSPPKKQEQVKKMIANSESSTGFINIQIVEDTAYICEDVGLNDNAKEVARGLISNVKRFINQTNFISLNQIKDDAAVSLDMKIKSLTYKEDDSSIYAFITVNFVIRKDGTEFYSQPYTFDTKRQSRSGRQGLPSREEILSEGSEYLAKKLIKDISPIKTRKLVELKELPAALAFTNKYAHGGNFSGAIKAMEKYEGEKSVAYYYNLGVYYEGLASEKDNMKLFVKAEENYDKAMAMGGSEDETIINGKMKFDNFYKIIKEVAEQNNANQKQNSSSEYTID